MSTVTPLTEGSQISTSTAQPSSTKPYIIFPKDRSNSTQINGTDKYIQNIIGQDSPSYIYNSPYDGVSNWAPDLTEDQLKKIVGYAGVDSVIENVKIAQKRLLTTSRSPHRNTYGSPSTTASPTTPAPEMRVQKRDGTITSQTSAKTDLSVIAQPSGFALADVKNYVYDDVAGEGAYVYLIEYGINVGHPEFRNMVHPPQQTDWIFVPRAPQTYDDSETDTYHGTCMGSKAVGAKLGVAKSARLVIVKSDDEGSEVLDAFQMALDHIRSNGRQGKAVVLYAGGNSSLPYESCMGSSFYARHRFKSETNHFS